jgi:heat shock protein HtpX
VYQEIARNQRRSVLYLLLFGASWVGVGALVGLVWARSGTGPDGAAVDATADVAVGCLVAAALAVAAALYVLLRGPRLILKVSGAVPADPHEHAALIHLVEALAVGAGLPTPAVYVIEDPSPNAFATGTGPDNAAITATTGLLAIMNREELEGVLAHELSHIRNYDVRLLLIVSTLIGMAGLAAGLIWRAAWFARSGRRDQRVVAAAATAGVLLALIAMVLGPLMRLALSRRREELADVSGVELTRNPAGLIAALRKLAANDEPFAGATHATAAMCIDDPLRHHAGWAHRLFDTHPPIAERIATLEDVAAGRLV